MKEKYSLRRVRDNVGCDGRHSHSIEYHTPEAQNIIDGPRPKLGCGHQVGMGLFDYWLTTEVTEILEDTPDMVRFKTKNSEYVWKQNSQLE